MTKVLYFTTDDQIEILNGVIRDGVVYIPKRDIAFYVSDVPKLNIVKRNLFGLQVSEPLFIVTYDCVVPAKLVFNTDENRKKLILEFKRDKMNNPESFYKIMNLKILGNMLKPKVNFSSLFMLIIGISIGVLLMYLLINMGILPLKPVKVV